MSHISYGSIKAPYGRSSDIKRNQQKIQRSLSQRFSKLSDAFRAFDIERKGNVTLAVFLQAIERLNLHVPEEEAIVLFKAADKNHDGTINYRDFLQQFSPTVAPTEVLLPRSQRTNGDIFTWSTPPRKEEKERMLFSPYKRAGVINELAPRKHVLTKPNVDDSPELIARPHSTMKQQQPYQREQHLPRLNQGSKSPVQGKISQERNVLIRARHERVGEGLGHYKGELPSDYVPDYSYGSQARPRSKSADPTARQHDMNSILSHAYGSQASSITMEELALQRRMRTRARERRTPTPDYNNTYLVRQRNQPRP
jgi:hypothetical protein